MEFNYVYQDEQSIKLNDTLTNNLFILSTLTLISVIKSPIEHYQPVPSHKTSVNEERAILKYFLHYFFKPILIFLVLQPLLLFILKHYN